MDISSSSAKNVKNFISGVVTPRLKRKATHSTSSDTLRSESVENMSQVGLFFEPSGITFNGGINYD